MRVVKRSLDKLVIEAGPNRLIEVEDVETVILKREPKWIVARESPNGLLITKADSLGSAETLAISMVERVKREEVHVAIGQQVGTLRSQRVWQLSTSYHWMP